MKFLVFVTLFALAAAQRRGSAPRPSSANPNDVVILRQELDNPGDGTYKFAYETSDGTKHEQSGYLKPNGNEDPIQVQQGSFAYYAPEGELIELSYIADENGFQPTANHLPTPPPIPVEIQKALDIIYAGIARGGGSAPQAQAPAQRRPASRPRPRF